MREGVDKSRGDVRSSILNNPSFKGLKEFQEILAAKKDSKKHKPSKLSAYARGMFGPLHKKRFKKLKGLEVSGAAAQEEENAVNKELIVGCGQFLCDGGEREGEE
eukprot:TRINITY_DN311_c0_g3_i1.p3 TRINITY_DN311_c0_g3~~TRINITY_DN311_c0_g3_i1.p3  ORF type:complete len:105 (-),score=20.02 TRINITY_DN311_c0_g3_i1:282-596(-)